MSFCKIDDCRKAAFARGWCRMHYMRWWVHGDPKIVLKKQTPAGKPNQFFRYALSYTGETCLLWPYGTNGVGYGQITKDGSRCSVHRIVCEQANGPAPSNQHFAIHKCGNGHLGCIAPNHLRWGTSAENSADMIKHGHSTRGEKCANAKLTAAQAIEIFRRSHKGENQRILAAEFGLSQTAVSCIKRGKNWGWLTKDAA